MKHTSGLTRLQDAYDIIEALKDENKKLKETIKRLERSNEKLS